MASVKKLDGVCCLEVAGPEKARILNHRIIFVVHYEAAFAVYGARPCRTEKDLRNERLSATPLRPANSIDAKIRCSYLSFAMIHPGQLVRCPLPQ